MKLGLYSSIANPPHGRDLDRCVQETIAEAVHAESAGFSGFFFGEHHQDGDGFLSSPLIVCAAVAARTERLQIGTSVVLLPLHHPVQVAEDVATLDIVSGGRAVLGVGLGYQPADFEMFGVERAQRASIFEESVEVLRRCWRGERFSFEGTHFRMREVQMLPAPLQQPMPLWIGAWAPAAVRRAARLADAWITGPSMTLPELSALADQYRSACAELNKEPRIVLMRDGWVAGSRAEAERVYGPEVMTAYRYYWRNQALAFASIRSEAEFTLENLAADRLILGTPAECVESLGRWGEALGADTVLLRLRHAHSGGPPHREIMQAIERFGRDVIPQLPASAASEPPR